MVHADNTIGETLRVTTKVEEPWIRIRWLKRAWWGVSNIKKIHTCVYKIYIFLKFQYLFFFLFRTKRKFFFFFFYLMCYLICIISSASVYARIVVIKWFNYNFLCCKTRDKKLLQVQYFIPYYVYGVIHNIPLLN
jgi:hypothetical protein